jgi:hypothetical protein
MNNNVIDSKQQKQGRMVFLLMILFFAVPIIVVLAMIKLDWRPIGQSNGDLINPPKKLSIHEPLKTSEGGSTDKLLLDKWNMVFVAKDCTDQCMERLHLIRQIHVSLYKDMPRVQRLIITESADVSKIKHDYPDMIVINQPKETVVNLMHEFDLPNENAETQNRIYLVDPLGNMVMSYRPEVKGEAIRKDVVRLLKYSWAG